MTPAEIAGGVTTLLTAIAYAQAASTWITASAPQAGPNSPRWWQVTRAVLDALARNSGNAANAPKPPTSPIAEKLG